MDKKIMKLDGTEIEEYRFHKHKSLTSITNIDIYKIVISKVYFL